MNRCAKKRWQDASEAYSKSVTELANKVGDMSDDEYEMLKKQIERTKAHSADTRNAFELHVDKHGC